MNGSSVKAKFHCTIRFEPASNQLRTSSELVSVMEFGFKQHFIASVMYSYILSLNIQYFVGRQVFTTHQILTLNAFNGVIVLIK